MHSDPHFQQLFQTHPDWLFDLLGEPIPANCHFTSPVVKAVQRQLDGYLTADDRPPTVVEIQMWPDAIIYARTGMELAQIAMQVHPQVPTALILFGSAELDPRTEPWCHFIRAVYLDAELERLAREQPDHLLLSVLFPLIQPDQSKLVAEGPLHYHRVKTGIAEPKDRDILLRVLTDFLFQRLPQHTHSQLAMMMNLTPLEETEGYKSLIRDATEKGLSQGLYHGLVRIVHRRFPSADAAIDEALSDLDYLQLERLADEVIDLPDLQALRVWLTKA
jgi:predicted transposase YdaD